MDTAVSIFIAITAFIMVMAGELVMSMKTTTTTLLRMAVGAFTTEVFTGNEFDKNPHFQSSAVGIFLFKNY